MPQKIYIWCVLRNLEEWNQHACTVSVQLHYTINLSILHLVDTYWYIMYIKCIYILHIPKNVWSLKVTHSELSRITHVAIWDSIAPIGPFEPKSPAPRSTVALVLVHHVATHPWNHDSTSRLNLPRYYIYNYSINIYICVLQVFICYYIHIGVLP